MAVLAVSRITLPVFGGIRGEWNSTRAGPAGEARETAITSAMTPSIFSFAAALSMAARSASDRLFHLPSFTTKNQVVLEGDQRVAILDLEGDVLDPFRRVRVAPHLGPGRQFEERQHVAVPGIQEQVHVGVGFVGRGHLVLGDGQDEVHVEVLHVPLDRLFCVLAAIGDVVDLVDLERRGRSCRLLRFQGSGGEGLAQDLRVADVVGED